MQRSWRFLYSIKLALILILMISGISLLGAFINELNVFHTWWFHTIGGLLILNIISCSINRWGNIERIQKEQSVVKDESFFKAGTNDEISAALSCVKITRILEEVLKKRGFKVNFEKDGENYYLAADKHRNFQYSTYLSHFSLVLLVLAYMLGSYAGFRDVDFLVIEGQIREIGHGTGLSLKLLSFVDEYYPDNTPKEYRSTIVLYELGQEVKKGVVRVNHPLKYRGIRIYQSYFGKAVQIQIKRDGMIVFQGSIPLTNLVERDGIHRYVEAVNLLGEDLKIQLISPALNVADTIIPPGQMVISISRNDGEIEMKLLKKGVPFNNENVEIVYQADTKYSGFQIRHDPANMLVWIASSLFLIGITMTFYFPYCQIWLLTKSQSHWSSQILVRLIGRRGFGGTSELRKLVGDIKKHLT